MNARETYTKIERLLRPHTEGQRAQVVSILEMEPPPEVTRKALVLFYRCDAAERERLVTGLRTLLLGETVE